MLMDKSVPAHLARGLTPISSAPMMDRMDPEKKDEWTVIVASVGAQVGTPSYRAMMETSSRVSLTDRSRRRT